MGDERIPITVVTGCLGVGKTTLINHVLDDPGDRSIAVVVNDVGEVNVDTELIRGATDDIVDLSNGCLCCQLQDDLRSTLALLRDNREFDCLLIEASGVSEPIPLARTLLGMDDEEPDPSVAYRLDTMVSVVDSVGFANAFDTETGRLREANVSNPRPLTDVLVETVEFCDLLLLNKCDALSEDSLDEVEALVRELQPNAELIRTTDAAVSPETILEIEPAGSISRTRDARRDGNTRWRAAEEPMAFDTSIVMIPLMTIPMTSIPAATATTTVSIPTGHATRQLNPSPTESKPSFTSANARFSRTG
ncbi:hypothetical protein GCM10009000_013310 [Halobacterium noricense]|uniref:CobW/HypB/UreG nucleotide-binding domain-containing protein n=1 Tax=Haladaptatus pallidirubidus TaxID=1008152 RepID=A0AAV3UBR9_9EURY